jgi:hypothetical protein
MWTAVNCLAVLLSAAAVPPDPAGSYLLSEVRGPDGVSRPRVEAYSPQEGDLVFFHKHSVIYGAGFLVAGSRAPYHVTIVVKRHDGTPAILEATFDREWPSRVCLVGVQEDFQGFTGNIWVRRAKRALTPEQSTKLTEFALAQQGKGFCFGRMLWEATPFSARTPLANKLFGRTVLDRDTWICSELIVAAGTVAGLFDPTVHHSNAILPADLYDDRHYDLSATWMPAAKWSSTPGSVGAKD